MKKGSVGLHGEHQSYERGMHKSRVFVRGFVYKPEDRPTSRTDQPLPAATGPALLPAY